LRSIRRRLYNEDMSRLAFTLHLTRFGPELRIAETQCSCLDLNGKALWTSEMAETTGGATGKETFPWTKPARALLLLLLRDLPLPPEQRFGLVGIEGTLARSLYELVTDRTAKGGGKTWLQKMFTDAKDKTERALNARLFHHEKRGERFFVSLGADWVQAEVKVFLDNKPVLSDEFKRLADVVERWDALPVFESSRVLFSVTLDLLVRIRATGRFESASDDPSLLPISCGDELQLHVQANQRSFICLAWIDQHGAPFPIYPWDWKKSKQKDAWGQSVKFEEQTGVIVPEASDASGNSLSVENQVGLETIVLMANREAPPSSNLVEQLPRLLRVGKLPSLPAGVSGIVQNEFARNDSKQRSAPRIRGPLIIKNPLRVLHETLGRCLAENFDHVGLLTFPTRDGSANKGIAERKK